MVSEGHSGGLDGAGSGRREGLCSRCSWTIGGISRIAVEDGRMTARCGSWPGVHHGGITRDRRPWRGNRLGRKVRDRLDTC